MIASGESCERWEETQSREEPRETPDEAQMSLMDLIDMAGSREQVPNARCMQVKLYLNRELESAFRQVFDALCEHIDMLCVPQGAMPFFGLDPDVTKWLRQHVQSLTEQVRAIQEWHDVTQAELHEIRLLGRECNTQCIRLEYVLPEPAEASVAVLLMVDGRGDRLET